MADYTLVEEMLPARVIAEIGIYLQSAAHLELAVWQIVMYADGEFEPVQQKFIDYLEVKKVTPKLVSQLKKSVPKLPPHLGIRISILATNIENGLVNLNLAKHGAFFLDKSELGVAHYYPQGRGSDRKWFKPNEKVSRRVISTAIEEIDGLLREAVSIREAIEAGRSKS